jgi:prevent-host-death family protein
VRCSGKVLDEGEGLATYGHMKKSKLVESLRARRGAVSPGMVEEASAEILRRRTTVSVREAKDQMSALLARVAVGEEVVITSDGEPRAMLVRYRPVVGGRPWRSLEAWRATMPMTPDSTSLVRGDRDSSY